MSVFNKVQGDKCSFASSTPNLRHMSTEQKRKSRVLPLSPGNSPRPAATQSPKIREVRPLHILREIGPKDIPRNSSTQVYLSKLESLLRFLRGPCWKVTYRSMNDSKPVALPRSPPLIKAASLKLPDQLADRLAGRRVCSLPQGSTAAIILGRGLWISYVSRAS